MSEHAHIRFEFDSLFGRTRSDLLRRRGRPGNRDYAVDIRLKLDMPYDRRPVKALVETARCHADGVSAAKLHIVKVKGSARATRLDRCYKRLSKLGPKLHIREHV